MCASTRKQLFKLIIQTFYPLFRLSFKYRLNPSVLRSQMVKNSFTMDNTTPKIDTIIPILSLLGALKKKFVLELGIPLVKRLGPIHPIQILLIDLFVYVKIFLIIIVDLKKKLCRIKYILRLSCVKTLARKHKSIVHIFLKKLGSELLEEFFTNEKLILFLTSSISQRFFKGRVWYLNIVCINELTHDKILLSNMEIEIFHK